MDWQDRRDIAQAARDEQREQAASQNAWDEFNLDELRRLWMESCRMESDVADLDMETEAPDDDRELLGDARYLAYKLQRALKRLLWHAEGRE